MRYKQLNENAFNQYKPMFNDLIKSTNVDEYQGTYKIQDEIDRYAGKVVWGVFKGFKPRIIWAMKWARLVLMNKYLKTEQDVNNTKVFEDAVRDGTFKHFFNIPYDKIKRFDPTGLLPPQYLKSLIELEEHFQNNTNQHVTLEGGEEIIHEFPDGFVWMDLKKSGCNIEAGAMGHCGNGEGKSGETILSLRKHIHDDIYRPAVTCILDKNGHLGEMKGRNNNKPIEKYHVYIEWLLKNYREISGIKGGGYKPENNFDIHDLKNPEDYKHLLTIEYELNKWQESKQDHIPKELMNSLKIHFANKNIKQLNSSILVEIERLDVDDYLSYFQLPSNLIYDEDKLFDMLDNNNFYGIDDSIIKSAAEEYSRKNKVIITRFIQENYLFGAPQCIHVEHDDDKIILYVDILYESYDEDETETGFEFIKNNSGIDWYNIGQYSDPSSYWTDYEFTGIYPSYYKFLYDIDQNKQIKNNKKLVSKILIFQYIHDHNREDYEQLRRDGQLELFNEV